MSKLDRHQSKKMSCSIHQDYKDGFSAIGNENVAPEQLTSKEVRPWDIFKSFPSKMKTGSMQDKKHFNNAICIVKIFVYCLLFCTVLCCGLVAKFAILFAVSQLREEKSVLFCDDRSDLTEEFKVKISAAGKVIWTWYIIFIFIVPEFFGILHAICYLFFKKRQKIPKLWNISVLLLVETLHPIGLALLVFICLPNLTSIEAAQISSSLCFVPVLLGLLSRYQDIQIKIKTFALILTCDVFALIAQSCGIFLQSLLNQNLHGCVIWIFPVALVLSSCRWWSNYVSHHSRFGFIRLLAIVKRDLATSRYMLEGFVALWRSFIFLTSAVGISILNGVQFKEFFEILCRTKYDIELIHNTNSSLTLNFLESNYFQNNIIQRDDVFILVADTSASFYTFLAHTLCAFIVYQIAKFAYRTHMHNFGFAFPLCLITPGTICMVAIVYIAQNHNPCAFNNLVPEVLSFVEPNYEIKDLFLSWYTWCWLIWWLSQMWITVHLWSSECEKLALVEKIFSTPTYDSIMLDQFLALSKKKHENDAPTKDQESLDSATEIEVVGSEEAIEMGDTDKCNFEFLKKEEDVKNICTTQIYACATMWHEEKEEMDHLIGSILRLDIDQCAMKVTQKYYNVTIEDYYELETHIFFDDAFRCMHGCTDMCDHDENETQVNQYVITLIETVQKNVESLYMRSSPPTKYPTPYGGRLVWLLPGKTRLTVHLKDKNKIRHRKRWSQVMYMYYLLGYRLMGLEIDVDRKEFIAENTYILTLDGDIDFRPTAVKVLVDLMKKDKDLGAACGRIHPVGKGPIVWFQKFEYAIGHWLQKSTEHTIGCVLCSPGCFSLFRAKALMQHNVMAKYATKSTEPRHYVQYDQGEDRWLCTLILQVGCRVEYSAASDAYTHAPETFKDFYVQRRRWIPSTMANVFDLLSTSKETRKVNNDISWLYIVYQWILMGSTILGPGTIFLMLIGAFVAAFHVDNWTSFWYNLIPIIIFIATCFLCKEHIQLLVAEIITAVYGLVMIVVLVGIMLQIAEDGWFSPSTLLFFIVAGQLVIAGLLHPQEWSCLICGIIYYITVPSMYMLLIIFSIFNIHNVTWGTRESKTQSKTSGERFTNIDVSETDKQKTEKGQLEFSFASLLKCTLRAYEDPEKESKHLNSIYNSINEMNIRLEQIESHHRIDNVPSNSAREIDEELEMYDDQTESNLDNPFYKHLDLERENVIQTIASTREPSNFLISPYWLQDERMRNGEVDFLSNTEEEFWKQLIEKYLYPIDNDEDKQRIITNGLINMRNEYLLKFFMINALFVVIIFLMQLNKDILHVKWPIGSKYNITYNGYLNEVRIYTEPLRLEPIGCVFIVAFVSILLIQFIAMLCHRFDTFSHILANTRLNLFCYNKKEYSTTDIVTGKYAKDIARGLQHVVQNEKIIETNNMTVIPGRRRTIRELTEDRQYFPRTISNFETLFRQKLCEPNLPNFMSMRIPRGAMEAFETRRSEIIAERQKIQCESSIYDEVNDFNQMSNTMKDKNKNNSKWHEYDNLAFYDENK